MMRFWPVTKVEEEAPYKYHIIIIIIIINRKKINPTKLSLNFGWPSLKKHDKVQKIWKKCFEKEKSIVPNSHPKFARPSLILKIRSKSLEASLLDRVS